MNAPLCLRVRQKEQKGPGETLVQTLQVESALVVITVLYQHVILVLALLVGSMEQFSDATPERRSWHALIPQHVVCHTLHKSRVCHLTVAILLFCHPSVAFISPQQLLNLCQLKFSCDHQHECPKESRLFYSLGLCNNYV